MKQMSSKLKIAIIAGIVIMLMIVHMLNNVFSMALLWEYSTHNVLVYIFIGSLILLIINGIVLGNQINRYKD